MEQRTRSFWSGVRNEFPLLIGVFPFGLIYGALAVNAGLAPALAQAMSTVVFAGAAQFIAAQLVHEAAPGVVILLSIVIVNLRHVLYSASLSPHVRQLPLGWRAILAYLLTDEAFAVTIVNYEREGVTATSHWFYLGAGFSLWLTWQASSALGIFLGTSIPPAWPLEFALPLTFIAMLMPMLKDRPVVAAALSSALAAALCNGLPKRLGLVLAALVGIGVGTSVEGRE
jgi:4-azaleucine resistance transporter AzlC